MEYLLEKRKLKIMKTQKVKKNNSRIVYAKAFMKTMSKWSPISQNYCDTNFASLSLPA